LPWVVDFCGNMDVAKAMASPKIFRRSLAREIMDSRPPRLWFVNSAGFVGGIVFSRLVRILLAVAIASEMGEWESTITSAFHCARV